MKAILLLASLLGLLFSFSACTSDNEDKVLIPVQVNEKWGYVDRNGSWCISPKFGYAGFFQDNGLAEIELDGEKGFIDKTGKIVVKPQFEMVEYFQDNGL
ncbi:MAG: WG repeat-containing protein, partial [Bacteroidaceae bacterium]|nr:WG repeat-containing protein [Bacteroidaceae bacterium]